LGQDRCAVPVDHGARSLPGGAVRRQQAVQNPDGRPLIEPGSFGERRVPEFLQLSPQALPPPRHDVAVDTRHARNVVAHPLGFEGLLDSKVIQPCPVPVPQAVGRQAWPYGPP
jgi:hypothetical protein